MPLYEYVCKDCNTRFDALVRNLAAADSVTCESCSGRNVRRLISTFATVGGFGDQATASQFKMSGGGGCCGGSCGCGH
jgi:putative FmdB family regulatory protein